jgi:hypothetical protein
MSQREAVPRRPSSHRCGEVEVVERGRVRPAAHEYGERERSHLTHEYRERDREAGPPHERTSMELTGCLRRRERSLLERTKMEKEREAQILQGAHERMKLLFEQMAVMCRMDGSLLFEETQIRLRCFGTLDWWRGHEVWASIFARKFFDDRSLNQPALKIYIFVPVA